MLFYNIEILIINRVFNFYHKICGQMKLRKFLRNCYFKTFSIEKPYKTNKNITQNSIILKRLSKFVTQTMLCFRRL